MSCFRAAGVESGLLPVVVPDKAGTAFPSPCRRMTAWETGFDWRGCQVVCIIATDTGHSGTTDHNNPGILASTTINCGNWHETRFHAAMVGIRAASRTRCETYVMREKRAHLAQVDHLTAPLLRGCFAWVVEGRPLPVPMTPTDQILTGRIGGRPTGAARPALCQIAVGVPIVRPHRPEAPRAASTGGRPTPAIGATLL